MKYHGGVEIKTNSIHIKTENHAGQNLEAFKKVIEDPSCLSSSSNMFPPHIKCDSLNGERNKNALFQRRP